MIKGGNEISFVNKTKVNRSFNTARFSFLNFFNNKFVGSKVNIANTNELNKTVAKLLILISSLLKMKIPSATIDETE